MTKYNKSLYGVVIYFNAVKWSAIHCKKSFLLQPIISWIYPLNNSQIINPKQAKTFSFQKVRFNLGWLLIYYVYILYKFYQQRRVHLPISFYLQLFEFWFYRNTENLTYTGFLWNSIRWLTWKFKHYTKKQHIMKAFNRETSANLIWCKIY